MPVSKTMWQRGLREDYAKLKVSIRQDREETTKEITRRWKEGFAALKSENDRLQKECDAKYRADMVENDAWLKRMIAQGPPND